MTTDDDETTAGSPGTPTREVGEVFGNPLRREVRRTAELRSEGVAGPSREVSKRDQQPSGAKGAGREDEELEWGRRNIPADPPAKRPVRSVFRKTELHGAAPASTPDECKKVRRRTMQNLKAPGGMIAYGPFEAAFREFICSLMERQDMVAEEMLLQYADLRQRLDAIEDRLEENRSASPGKTEAGP